MPHTRPNTGPVPLDEPRRQPGRAPAGRVPVRRPALSYRRQNVLFLAPYLLGTVILVIVPACMTLGVAFTDYSGIGTPKWVGVDNFRRLGSTPLVRIALYNTLIFAGLAVPLRLLGALLFALLMRERRGAPRRHAPRRVTRLARGAVYLPAVLPEAAYALVWLWILNPVSGPLNLLLGALGLPAPAWLVEVGASRVAIVLMALLQIGEGFVVLLAARESIDPALYEAAEVDGANRWQGFWSITLPLITPWLLLLLCRDLIVAVQNTFAPSFMLAYGGPVYATTFLPLLIFELSFDFTDWGLASAVLVVVYAWILLLIWGVRNLVAGLRGREAAPGGEG